MSPLSRKERKKTKKKTGNFLILNSTVMFFSTYLTYVRVSTVRARIVAMASTPLLIPLDKDEKVISWQRRTPTKWIGIQI